VFPLVGKDVASFLIDFALGLSVCLLHDLMRAVIVVVVIVVGNMICINFIGTVIMIWVNGMGVH
jgi:hypothetical protein